MAAVACTVDAGVVLIHFDTISIWCIITRIALIGSGTIGLSFAAAALHLSKNTTCTVTIHDTRPDLQQDVSMNIPGYLIDTDQISCIERLSFANIIEEAVKSADIIQGQGPENADFTIGSGTIQNCWDASDEDVRKGNIKVGQSWHDDVCRQAAEIARLGAILMLCGSSQQQNF